LKSAPLSKDTLEILPVESKADLKRFIEFPWQIYRDDPVWISPLRMERREHLNPKKNPFFDHAEVQLFLARRSGEIVGRISAQIDALYLDRYNDATGHFGMLEAIDDPDVFGALIATAEAWLAARGMTRAVGPFNLSVNEESGLLVDGFDTPPAILMGHARGYYGERVEACGYAKIRDLVCYRYTKAMTMPPKVEAFVARAAPVEGLVVRHVNLRNFLEELTRILDVFNDAWTENWGYVPMSDSEIRHMAKSLKPIIRRETAVIAEIDGRPVAMAVTLPNVNEAIADLNGRLFPVGWLKLLWRLKVRHPKSVRMPLMGVRREFHGRPLGALLAFAVIKANRDGQESLGVEWSELSWILEDNTPMRNMIEQLGAEVYKTYRLYERALA
jgi:GNAT superfamily N-acetyltransferase